MGPSPLKFKKRAREYGKIPYSLAPLPSKTLHCVLIFNF